MPIYRMLLTLLEEAVDQCYEKDFLLIDRSMEQACVTRICIYMQERINKDKRFRYLKKYNLDCEYNKAGDEIKATPRRMKGTRPDLILHKRGENTNNLMVVEFKPRKAHNKKDSATGKFIDEVKLEDFTSSSKYNYKIGVWVKLYKKGPKYAYYSRENISDN